MTPSAPLPPVQAYRPSTFRERGVAVPFTSPLVAGARVRGGQRDRVELVVPNPSGGRGVYILPWQSARALFCPSVHDSCLYKRIAGLAELTPSAVRSAGLEMACRGLAGRPAMAAAIATRARDEEERLLTSFLLLVALAEQAEPGGLGRIPQDSRPSPELEQRASQILERIAPRFDRAPRDILNTLSAMTDVFSPTGVALQSSYARLPRLLERVTQLRIELVDWAHTHADGMHIDLAEMVSNCADIAICATEVVLAKTWGMTHDMAGLLRSWSKVPERIIELAARPDWLLDGWEQVCLLWSSSTTQEERRGVMTEMAQRVPVLPREISSWAAIPTDRDDGMASQEIGLDKGWRTGAADLHLTARNERMRAFAM